MGFVSRSQSPNPLKSYGVHINLLDFVSRSKSPNPLEKGALKVPLEKGDLGGFSH
jgi:hypothetical protein